MGDPPRTRRALPLLAGFAVAAAALSLAATPSLQWASWFHHPGRGDAIPPTTLAGAAWLRAMLVALAIAAPLAAAALDRLASPPPSHPVAPSRLSLKPILLLLLLALALRAQRIGDSLWYDELAAWGTFGVHGPGVIVGNLFDPANHVAHTLATWVSAQLFADALGGLLSLRLPALAFSLVCVAAIAQLGARALGVRGGLVAGLVAAAAPVCVLEGAEARGYSMMIAFAALATLTLDRALRPGRGPWPWVFYAAICAAGVWSHLVTAFVPAGHVLWLGWNAARGQLQQRTLAAAAVSLALAAVLSLTLLAPGLPDLFSSRTDFRRAAEGQPGLLGVEGATLLLQLTGSWTPWAAIPGGALLILGAARLRRDPRGRDIAAAALLGLPLLVFAVAATGTWVYARFGLFAIPGVAILLAAGIEELWSRRREWAFAAIAVTLATWTAEVLILPPRQPLREAAEYVRARATPGEPVLVLDVAHAALRAYEASPTDSGPPLQLLHSLGPHRDLPRRLSETRPRFVIVLFPNVQLTPDRLALLHAAGYTQTARLNGWGHWGDVPIYTRQAP